MVLDLRILKLQLDYRKLIVLIKRHKTLYPTLRPEERQVWLTGQQMSDLNKDDFMSLGADKFSDFKLLCYKHLKQRSTISKLDIANTMLSDETGGFEIVVKQ
jgi:hypothetical protein